MTIKTHVKQKQQNKDILTFMQKNARTYTTSVVTINY